ncbi:MAG: DUF2867 domain-containing protein [Tannerella sp.]|jgi:hypothetical protein|nr:DUF2867 domain-containing protein [Tannerella sp.]
MKKIIRLDRIPDNSMISDGFTRIDYYDTYQLTKNTNQSIEQITEGIFNLPGWVNWLMILRNSIVRLFGLKTEKNRDKDQEFYFTVIDRNENEIVMGEDDKHLNFRTSTMIDRDQSFIYLTTLVQFHNKGGRFYFLVIKPFHQFLMRQLLKRL